MHANLHVLYIVRVLTVFPGKTLYVGVPQAVQLVWLYLLMLLDSFHWHCNRINKNCFDIYKQILLRVQSHTQIAPMVIIHVQCHTLYVFHIYMYVLVWSLVFFSGWCHTMSISEEHRSIATHIICQCFSVIALSRTKINITCEYEPDNIILSAIEHVTLS